MKKWMPRVLLFFWMGAAFGKDFGSVGHVFPIQEENLLEVMQAEVTEEKVRKMALKVKKILLKKGKNPSPVENIKKAQKNRTFLLDFSFRVREDVRDREGRILVKAGTRINPLKEVSLSTGILFIDGNMKSHISWAKEQGEDFKWILVKGRPVELEEVEKRPVYFDQGGAYTARFKIENIPAKVVQKGEHLIIEEIFLNEEEAS